MVALANPEATRLKKIGKVSSPFEWRAWPALIDEDCGDCAVHGSHVEDYCRAPRWNLTTRCHGYIIGDKRDEGQDAPPRVDMGNVG